MDYIFLNQYVYFKKSGTNKPIILLHGWGVDSSIYDYLAQNLAKDYLVYQIDLPGFGKSEEPICPYSLDDYVKLLRQFITDKNIENPIILGHSFGGRIVIKYASLYHVEKLILVDSAGLKKRNYHLVKTKIKIYQLKKKWYRLTKNIIKYHNLIKNSGSDDYQNASIIMKKTMINITNEYLEPLLKNIKCDTLIIWGKKDTTTPYYQALKLKKKIKNAGLVTLEGAGHFPFLESKQTFIKILKVYLEA